MKHQKNPLVVGDIMLDKYSFWEIKRLNPEEPWAPLVSMPQEHEYRLWGAANVGANIASLNGAVDLIGLVGKDREYMELKKLCEEINVNLHAILTQFPTIQKRRIMAGRQIVRLDSEVKMHLDDFQKQEILEKIHTSSWDYLIFSDYDKGIVSKDLVEEIKKIAVQKNMKILGDIKPKNIELFDNIYVLKPNFKEFCEMVWVKIDKKDKSMIEKFWKEFVKKMHVNLVLTKSEEWATIITQDWQVEHLPITKQDVIDVSGAWDTFLAGLTVGLGEGKDLLEAVKLGNKASGVVVGKVGTAVVKKEEILHTL